jgi:hypothetical protein
MPMAQLYIVYVVTNPAMPGLVKIGRTTQEDAQTRIAQLYSTGVPFPFRLEFACRVANPDEVETALHTAFSPQRVNARREFFSIDPAQAIAILKLLHTEDATAELAPAITTVDQQEVAAGEQYRRTRRPNMNFDEMGIPMGSKLESTTSDAFAIVCGPKRVKFQNEETSLTAATRQVLGLEYSVAPGTYWTYNGRLVSHIYEETYPAAE